MPAATMRGATTAGVVRPIAVADARLGSVEVDGPEPAAGAVAELLTRAIALAARPERGFAEARIARAAIDAELAVGRRIQLSLMPRRFPVVPGWEIASAYEPAREVGGDFYDAFAVRGDVGRLGIVVADVTGKGVPAALLMADTRALIHAAVDHGSDPADALGRVNRILVGERASGLFVTVALGVLDAASGALAFASAGHDPIHVLRSNGGLTILEPSGRLVGMVADLAATSTSVELLPGDAFVGHTDGITEARAPDGSFYGEERFRSLLTRLAGGSAAEIVEAIVRDVTAFRNGAEPSDDLTLLVVRRLPGASGALR
jgi:phosphoserine phosphatase RsbU/P